MICECSLCHRLLIDGVWTVRAGVVAQVMGTCPTCGAWQKRAQEAKWQREGRELLQQRKRGYGPGTGDPFAGF